jgi:hypothetical protein
MAIHFCDKSFMSLLFQVFDETSHPKMRATFELLRAIVDLHLHATVTRMFLKSETYISAVRYEIVYVPPNHAWCAVCGVRYCTARLSSDPSRRHLPAIFF